MSDALFDDAAAEDEAGGPAQLAPGEPDLPGPFAVGRWAEGFRGFLRRRPRVRLLGEVVNLSRSAKAVYFDLRDADGAVPCSMWNSDLEKMGLAEGALVDGVEVVVAGGPDYFAGSQRSSPSFSFRVTYLRPAGEGDLLAQLERLRKQLAAEGLFEPQKALPRPRLPRTLGVVVGGGSAALADILAGLQRRSWRGRLVLAHPPVQGKGASGRIATALRDLAALPEVETIIVARGGGSLTDLWCFCDEALCRTVALLRVPVISAVGHETDRTLIDDVANTACSTPTHAAETAVGLDVSVARSELRLGAATVARAGRRAVAGRARSLGAEARALSHHTRSQRTRLHQLIREVRAASRRLLGGRHALAARHALVLQRRRQSTLAAAARGRGRLRREASGIDRHRRAAASGRGDALARLAATLAAHDPDRVLERGYAIVERPGGEEVLTTAAAVREAGAFRVRLADDHVEAEVSERERGKRDG
jgi:exodeoxyribonuclease VII large subunit